MRQFSWWSPLPFALSPLPTWNPRKLLEMRQPCYDEEVPRHAPSSREEALGSWGAHFRTSWQGKTPAGVHRHCLGAATCSWRTPVLATQQASEVSYSDCPRKPHRVAAICPQGHLPPRKRDTGNAHDTPESPNLENGNAGTSVQAGPLQGSGTERGSPGAPRLSSNVPETPRAGQCDCQCDRPAVHPRRVPAQESVPAGPSGRPLTKTALLCGSRSLYHTLKTLPLVPSCQCSYFVGE